MCQVISIKHLTNNAFLLHTNSYDIGKDISALGYVLGYYVCLITNS